jgi:hypothetical protein
MAICDTQILGHFIPQGTEIVLHIGHAGLQNSKPSEGDGNMQRPSHRAGVPKPLWHGDGESFNPDRWLDERGGFCPNAGVALPFGAGPRKCYGYKLAVSYTSIRCIIYKNSLQILQMKLALVELTRRFYIEPPSDPALDSWKVRETVNRIPLHNYIVMRSWKEVTF